MCSNNYLDIYGNQTVEYKIVDKITDRTTDEKLNNK